MTNYTDIQHTKSDNQSSQTTENTDWQYNIYNPEEECSKTTSKIQNSQKQTRTADQQTQFIKDSYHGYNMTSTTINANESIYGDQGIICDKIATSEIIENITTKSIQKSGGANMNLIDQLRNIFDKSLFINSLDRNYVNGKVIKNKFETPNGFSDHKGESMNGEEDLSEYVWSKKFDAERIKNYLRFETKKCQKTGELPFRVSDNEIPFSCEIESQLMNLVNEKNLAKILKIRENIGTQTGDLSRKMTFKQFPANHAETKGYPIYEISIQSDVYVNINSIIESFKERCPLLFEASETSEETQDFRTDLMGVTNRNDYSNRYIFYGQILIHFLTQQNRESVWVDMHKCPCHKFLLMVMNHPKKYHSVTEIDFHLRKGMFSRHSESMYIYGYSGCNCSYEIINPQFNAHEILMQNMSPEKYMELIKQACYMLDIPIIIGPRINTITREQLGTDVFSLGCTRNSLNGAMYYNYLHGREFLTETHESGNQEIKNFNYWMKSVPDEYQKVYATDFPTAYDFTQYTNNQQAYKDQSFLCYSNSNYQMEAAPKEMIKKRRGRPRKEKQYHPLSGAQNSSVYIQSDSSKRKSRKEISCINCKTTSTSLWRKHGDDNICNSCGLYYRLHGRHRDIIKKDIVRRRRRINGVLVPSKASQKFIRRAMAQGAVNGMENYIGGNDLRNVVNRAGDSRYEGDEDFHYMSSNEQ